MKIDKRQFPTLAAAFEAWGAEMPEIRVPADRQAEAKNYRQSENRKRTARRSRAKKTHIAILDFETDPFNNKAKDNVFPFVAELYAPEFEPIIIWDEDHESFVNRVVKAIEDLPGSYTIYAHNGGKFDFMFLIHKLRGSVSFKGRGIMAAQIGNHHLRDSYHIIPEKLASLQKQEFVYEKKLVKGKRAKYRKEILEYLHSDCENLYFYVKRFIERYGFKISVGAASLAKLREHYEIERISETTDDYLRRYFFGGRVECLVGMSHFKRKQKLYDINSAYPDAMSRLKHPIGSEYIIRSGAPNAYTAFLTLECRNRGALMARAESGEVTTSIPEGVFHTTIHEYKMALELGLISDVKIIECVDNMRWTDFSKFIDPIYEGRAQNKNLLDSFTKGTVAWNECNTEVVFDKLIMNNAYGKTAQDPRRFKEHWITDPGKMPERDKKDTSPYDWQLEFSGNDHWIWTRPSAMQRFLNVGTGASITGAVRAKLMHAIANAINPVYCDTDSIICDDLPNIELDHLKLGAWDLEKQISELYICGKKLYGYRAEGQEKPYVKSKGASGMTWEDMEAIFAGGKIVSVNFGPTLTRNGSQTYIQREIRATAKTLLERTATL